ncbi:MAG: outer membrane lipoprotein-sorting protein [Pseudomonadales bacterium]|nr:outer membrane lipoprotein-sorting protein [Pseudomonadales bacterium]
MNEPLPGCAIALGLVAILSALSVQAATDSDTGYEEFNVVTQDIEVERSAEPLTQYANASGETLIKLMHDQHQQYPYVYEEQSMVLIDRQGNRETRNLRRYSRVDEVIDKDAGAMQIARYMLVFDSPNDLKGVVLLAEKKGDKTSQSIYLPAFGKVMITNEGDAHAENFLGSDFSIENLIGEDVKDYDYRRQRDAMVEGMAYFIVDVFGKSDANRLLRRHFIRQDNLYGSRTDHYDDLGRLQKRQSNHDLTQVIGSMWRANMILMDDKQTGHQSLLKINRRVFSADYVPLEYFTPQWLYQNTMKELQYEPADKIAPQSTQRTSQETSQALSIKEVADR